MDVRPRSGDFKMMSAVLQSPWEIPEDLTDQQEFSK
jgi:hypothetical protein